jgi:hypothetical protein
VVKVLTALGMAIHNEALAQQHPPRPEPIYHCLSTAVVETLEGSRLCRNGVGNLAILIENRHPWLEKASDSGEIPKPITFGVIARLTHRALEQRRQVGQWRDMVGLRAVQCRHRHLRRGSIARVLHHRHAAQMPERPKSGGAITERAGQHHTHRPVRATVTRMVAGKSGRNEPARKLRASTPPADVAIARISRFPIGRS